MRSALVIAHTTRHEITRMAAEAADQLRDAGFEVRMLADEAIESGCDEKVTVVSGPGAAQGAEVVLVFGGDGTFLRAAEFARPAGVAMLGVNFGRVGFLAEADPEALTATVKALVDRVRLLGGRSDRLAERRRTARRAECGARAVRASHRGRSGLGRRPRPHRRGSAGRARLRRAPLGRHPAGRQSHRAPRCRAGAHRAHSRLELRRAPGDEVPASGAWFP